MHTFNPRLGRQRQADLCEFKAGLVYRVSSRTARAITEKPCLERQTDRQTNVFGGQAGRKAGLEYTWASLSPLHNFDFLRLF